ncbi:MAG: flagellar basal-body MS-ring/collar protein FliF [Vicinamibacterales bacterium]
MSPDQLLAHLKRLTSTLTPRQIASLAGVFVAVVGVVAGSAYWVNAPSYVLLYSDLDAESAAAVTARLKGQEIPYVLEEGGRAIRVPAERVDELRLDLASQGLPTTGRIGFEIFDRTAFGTTEFLEHVNYRRGLEGELARTIGTIAEVASARVHIALARDSLFTAHAEEAKASVVLKLRSSKPLSAATVNGIAGLVAASVESLRPEAVVIVDTFGRPLTQGGAEAEEATGASVERQQRVERDMAARVVALLEPVVGPGHVRVNVSAKLDIESQEETEERWDPTTVVRSRQASSEGTAAAGAGGIAGARANAPPASSTAPAETAAPVLAAAPPGGRTTETTNYEVSKVTRHTIVPQGRLSRLSVAVILDDERTTATDESGRTQVSSKPRSPEDLERVQRLVAAAVGLDPARGDQLTVENIAFGDQSVVEQPPAGPLWRELPRQVAPYAPQILRIAAVVGIALLALVMILRPMMRAVIAAPALQAAAAVGAPGQTPRTVAEMENAIEAELDAALPESAEARRLPVLSRRIARRAEEQPEDLARLVRSWLTEEER